MDGDWRSLDELGPLSQLRFLELVQLENVSAASFAANARLGEKTHLITLTLVCTSKLGDDGFVKEKEDVSEEEQQRIEKVLDKLCPPPGVEFLQITGYFGRQLPSWMISTSMLSLNNLKTLLFDDLACCRQLPNGLCQPPNLFVQLTTASFPRLNVLKLFKMLVWEEWEEQVQSMHRLENLTLCDCKPRHFPLGLASNASSLKILGLQHVKQLSYIESFPYRITNFPNLQKLAIAKCPKLKVLERIASLSSLGLEDYTMEERPEYMRNIKLRNLQLFCGLWLLSTVAAGQSGTEWDKFSHVEHVQAYAPDGDNERKWYVLYTRGDNCKLDSNFSSSTVFEGKIIRMNFALICLGTLTLLVNKLGKPVLCFYFHAKTLSSSMVDAQGFESMYKMRRRTFSYVCSLVRIPFFEDMMARDHTFVDGRLLSLQDRVAVALRVLNSGDSPVTVGSSLGVNESTVSLLTHVFVEAMWDRAMHHCSWPRSTKMEKIKHKFDKMHGLPNCCGVVHTAHITFGSQNPDHEENDVVLVQAVIDLDMRTEFWLDGDLLECIEKYAWLNGGKLKLSDGPEVGEYIIGDAGYPLRPWLLTPYQLENGLPLSESKVEFNMRHSAATAVAARWLQGEGWHPNKRRVMNQTIGVCYMLHNIVIDLEEDEGASMPSGQEDIYVGKAWKLADEDAVTVRNALSQHLIGSGVHTMAEEEEQAEVAAVASGSGDGNKEEEARQRQMADRGKEKVHDG
ncbi:hypothetical protein VPH35_055887 [Triticum aestivum]